MTEQPTDNGWAARSILTYLRPGWRDWPDKRIEDTTAGVKTIIEHEAVAPAVRELIEALNNLADWEDDTWRISSDHPNDRGQKEDWAADIAKAREVINRYRHLLKESER